jgi:hypothetical protein
MATDSWPFTEPKILLCSQQPVMERKEPVLLISHDTEDHAWQVIGATSGTLENARIISLQKAMELDLSVVELSDLPIGWRAVRESSNGPWRREPCLQ